MLRINISQGRKILLRLLKSEPDDHWLLSRISSCYYEERNYRKALVYSTEAIKFAPSCPLALMDHAACLDMLGRGKEAIEIWRRLLRKGKRKIAVGECGEGIRSAKEIVNSCRYRLGVAYADLGRRDLAIRYLKLHLKFRQRGIPCPQTKREVKARLKRIETENRGRS